MENTFEGWKAEDDVWEKNRLALYSAPDIDYLTMKGKWYITVPVQAESNNSLH